MTIRGRGSVVNVSSTSTLVIVTVNENVCSTCVPRRVDSVGITVSILLNIVLSLLTMVTVCGTLL